MEDLSLAKTLSTIGKFQVGPDIPLDEFKTWIANLRSGKFSQTHRTLQNSQGFCCLGVLCETVVPGYTRHPNGFLADVAPHIASGAPYWVAYINEDFAAKHSNTISLIAMNDEGYSFNDIADILEKTYLPVDAQ